MRTESRIARYLSVVPLFLLLGSTQPGLAQDGAEEAPKLPPPVAEALRWLPAETDTIVVARSVVLPKEPGEGRPAPSLQADPEGTATRVLQRTAAGPLAFADDPAYLALLAGREAAWAVHGARNYEPASLFGGLRYEGAHVLIFEKDLGDAVERLTKLLREKATEVKTIAGKDVYVLKWNFPKEPYIRTKPWEGLFVVRPEARVLLYGTSEAYLKELLERRKQNPTKRAALPDDLPEWKHLDPAVPAWAVRHPAKAGRGGRRAAAGMLLSLTPEEKEFVRIVYLPADNKSPEKLVRRRWLEPELFKELQTAGMGPMIRKDDDNTTVLTISSPGPAKMVVSQPSRFRWA